MLATVIIADRPIFVARSNWPSARSLKICALLQPSIASARSNGTAETFFVAD